MEINFLLLITCMELGAIFYILVQLFDPFSHHHPHPHPPHHNHDQFWRKLKLKIYMNIWFAPALMHLLRRPSFCPTDVIWERHVTKWCHQWHHMTSWHSRTGQDFTWSNSNQKTGEITFFVPMTLTFDVWPWPSNSSEILSRSIPVPTLVPIHRPVWP